MTAANQVYGVVEGFYGRPWSPAQRCELFERMATLQFNTYLYAPKDDLKHRAYWRELYAADEINQLRTLVGFAKHSGLNVWYGISPGLDMQFSLAKDQELLLAKIGQLLDIGVRGISLLFDDIPGKMSAVDRAAFASVAAAHCAVAERVLDAFGKRDSSLGFAFCPTPYCSRMVASGLGGSDYLDVVGQQLPSEFDIFWTGPEIISEHIPTQSLTELADRIGRPPILWDNLHANDYDVRRLFCGPYQRKPEIKSQIRGVLLNANCELPANHVPFKTLSDFAFNPDYNPDEAYEASLNEWLSDYALGASDDCGVELNDLRLLCDCFYLPQQLGRDGLRLLKCAQQLLTTDGEHRHALADFQQFHTQIVRLFDTLPRLQNRELFYSWSRRVWELREELDMLAQLIDLRHSGELSAAGAALGSHLPGTYRGGMVAQLQQLVRWKKQRLVVNEHS